MTGAVVQPGRDSAPETAASGAVRTDAPDDGRIPFRLRIGVTGHRSLVAEDALAESVREAVERIRALVPATAKTSTVVTVVSALAEGTDRLVAREILEDETAVLEAPLPFARADYRRDFVSASSREEFDALLARAATVIEPPTPAAPEEAYERVGRYVVDRCDVLLALWDGAPARGRGGTADIVDYARARETPLVWIETTSDHAIHEELGEQLEATRSSFRDLDEFNRAEIVPPVAAAKVAAMRAELTKEGVSTAVGETEIEILFRWALPYFVRADILAGRFQFRFYRLTRALYFAATAAVAAVALQAFFVEKHTSLVWSEVVLLLFLLFVVVYGRRSHLHRRWLDYRFLAERFRSGIFLAAAGLGQRLEGGLEGTSVSAEDWLQRAFTEVWNRRPEIKARGGSEALRSFLATRWIGDQINWYAGTQGIHARRHRLLLVGVYAAFGLTIAAAVPHSLGYGENKTPGHLFSVLSLSLPALGASFSALAAQREYQRNSQRYERMIQALAPLKERMETAPDEASIRRIAALAEATMLEENQAWLGVMQFHDFELT